MRFASLLLAITTCAGNSLSAQVLQQPAGTPIVALGQPEIWKASVGAGAGLLSDGSAAEVRAGLYRDLINPVTSLAGVQVDAWLGLGNGSARPGLRAKLVSPFARFGLGADWDADDGLAFLLSVHHPLRRGGLFHDGSLLRLDWVPGKDRLMVGVEKPVLRRIPQGRTRPTRDQVPFGDHVPTPDHVPSADLVRSADAISSLTVVFLDQGAKQRADADTAAAAHLRSLAGTLESASSDAHIRRFHAELDRMFGPAVAATARAVLLERVLLPYDRLLGQRKPRAVFEQLLTHAQRAFDDVVREQSASASFASLLGVIAKAHDALLAQWQDSRFVFLPLQFALLPEQHDTQAELDALIERAIGRDFSDGNFVSYAINEQYQYQLSRTIRQAQDYHVLWTHDVRGFDAHGNPDEMAFRQVLHSYLQALTERVQAYDSAGKLPVYIILLDQWFYEVNRGRLWMNLLEDPLGHQMKLPRGYGSWEDSISSAQDRLRAAVAASKRLQEDRRRYGDAWLRSVVRVQVNITNPPDATFWSSSVIHYVPLPDNMMRDHRKLVFYDVTEDDPYKGEGMFTGAGVGEHYANLSWEDRTLLVRGPALLNLKNAARELLLLQGMAMKDVPAPLQQRPLPADYTVRLIRTPQADQRPLRALSVHNGVGFNDKQVNVAKAILYTLMPPGSVIKIPDSLWNSMFWGGALLGAAVRGARVLIIAPSAQNAPVDAAPTLSREHEMISRLLAARDSLAPAMNATGGMVRIGLYAPSFEVTDIPAKLRAVQHTFEQHAWLRELFGFPQPVYQSLADLADAFSRISMKPTRAPEFEYDPTPKLHLKANFFASKEAWTLMTRPEWGPLTWEYVQQRIAQVQSRAAAVQGFEDIAEPFIDVGGAVVQDWLDSLSPQDRARVAFYTVMGSQNQNYRSMVVDAEVGLIVSGWPSVIPYLDFISLIGQSKWIERPEDLETLLPAPSNRNWRMGRWIKNTT